MELILQIAFILSGLNLTDEIQETIKNSINQVEVLSQDSSTKKIQQPAPFKCRSGEKDEEELLKKESSYPFLDIYLSFSVPLETWREYSIFLEKYSGRIILNGFPNNSIQEFSKKITQLRKEGVNADIEIDPDAFIANDIGTVPAIILKTEQGTDKICGNIKLVEAIRIFSEKGDS